MAAPASHPVSPAGTPPAGFDRLAAAGRAPGWKSAGAALAAAVLDAIESAEWTSTTGAEHRAWLVTRQLAAALCCMSPLHVPSPDRLRSEAARLERDAAIARDFTGRNYHALAAEHELSVRHVRRIVQAHRAARRRPVL